MCDPGMDELQKTLKRHDRLNELEAFIKEAGTSRPPRHWWLVNASKIRKLLAPFDESTQSIPPGTIIPDKRKTTRRQGNPQHSPIEERRGLFPADRRK